MGHDASLGPLLRRLRTSVGLTQEELAERASVSARTISDIERGLRRSVYRDTAARLADALDLDDQGRSDLQAVARGRGGGLQRSSSGPSVAGRIPVPPTKLIGRDEELELVLRSLSDDGIRMLTITGPGGIGKTRLATEAAARAHVLFSNVSFIPLAPIERPDLVRTTIAAAVGLSPLTEPTPRAIAQHLGAKAALLVLDTFEHVIDAAQEVTELLASSSGVKVLITSREALRVRGEHVIPLAALPVPAAGRPGDEPSPAVQLFVDRARAGNANVQIDAASPEIEDICRRLGGLPLAIELAAARIRHLSIEALRDRLSARLDVLAAGPRDLPLRQQTMRDTIAWSYDLLSEAERSLFRAVSAFAGGWTAEAAAAVWPQGSSTDVFDTLNALADKSLVLVSQDEQPRYTMLDVIVEFGRAVTSEEERSDLARSHGAFFAALAARAEAEFGGPANERWYARLALEHDNLRRALSWALSQREIDLATQMAGSLWQFWRARGHYSEGRTWLGKILAFDGASDIARANALWGAAWLALHQGDLDDAERSSKELTSLTARDRDERSRRNALTVRGMVSLARGEVEEALGMLKESEAICADLGIPWLLATSKLNLALAQVHARRPRAAYPLLDEARAIYRDLGDHRFGPRTDTYRGYAALVDARPDEARQLFLTSLRAFDDAGDVAGIAEGLEGLAAVSAAVGESSNAATLIGAAEATRAELRGAPHPFEKVLVDRIIEPAKAATDSRVWERDRDTGRGLALEDAVAFACALGDASGRSREAYDRES